MAGISATITNVGLNLLRDALAGIAQSPAIAYVALGTGAAQLAVPLIAGVPYTTLAVNALPAGLTSGQSLTILYQTNSDTVTLAGPASAGATSIPIQSWTPAFAYPAGAGLVNTPSVLDTQLQAEVVRKATGAGSAGAAAGESLHSAYFGISDLPGTTFLEAGFYGGPSANAQSGSGVLIARGLLWWQHTSSDSSLIQLDSVL